MRIVSMRIDGFGHFSGGELGPFTAPLTVIQGLNEAGKTTLLAFIRTMLFGWPAKGRADHYPPLDGGRHGGRLVFVTGEGQTWAIERWEDGRRAHFQLTHPDGRSTDDERVLQRILGGTSRETFEDVFAFGLDEMRDLAERSAEEVFAAGVGARGVPAALKRLDEERDALFKPGGSKPAINQLLDQLQAIDSRLTAARGQAAEYATLTARRAALDREIAAAQGDVDELEREQRQVADLVKGWEPWVRGQQLRAELANLPATADIPEDGVARLDAAENAVEREQRSLDETTTELDEARRAAEVPVADVGLLDRRGAIEDLTLRLAGYQKAVAELPKRMAEAEQKAAELDDQLRNMGPGWDAARVETFDTSESARQMVEQLRTALATTGLTLREARSEEERRQRTIDEAIASAESAERELQEAPRPRFRADEIQAQSDALRRARRLSIEQSQAQSARQQAETELSFALRAAPGAPRQSWRRIAGMAVVALAGLIGFAAGVSAGAVGGVLGLAFAVCMGLVIAAIARRPVAPNGSTSSRAIFQGRVDDARERERAIADELAATAAHLGCDPAGMIDVELADARIGRDQRALEAYAALEETARQRRATVAQARKALDDAAATRATAEASHQQARDAWQRWLRERGLDDELEPEFVKLLFERVEHARDTIRELDGPGGRRHRQQRMEDDNREYEAAVAAEWSAAGEAAAPASPAEVVAAVQSLGRRLSEASSAIELRRQAREACQLFERKRNARAVALDEARRSVQALFECAGVDDSGEYRAAATVAAKRRTIEEQLNGCESQLVLLSGHGAALDGFRATLAATSHVELQSRAQEVNERRQARRHEAEQLRDERSRVIQQLNQLVGDTQASTLRTQRAELVERLQALAHRWSELTIARKLIDEARERYERERQPGVVRDAQAMLASITAGRYLRIIPEIDGHALQVEDRLGRRTDANHLSRGTLEQLYLALRFGLVRQLTQRGTTLPVVVDEVLVNFDAERGQRVACAFAELAATNQVIVFTCHRWVVEMFECAGACELHALEDRAPALSG